LVGSSGADNFVFGPTTLTNAPAAHITHVVNYSAAEGDTFDFAGLTSQFHFSEVGDASLVRAVEDPSGNFATLQVAASNSGEKSIGVLSTNWLSIAQIDGAHAGDAVSVLLDSHGSEHIAHVNAGWVIA